MTKEPGEHAPLQPMSKEERDANKAFRKVEAETAMSDHQAAEKAFAANRERLKAERLAREAAEPPKTTKKKPRGS